jgi:plasmid stabilization system protein ParE
MRLELLPEADADIDDAIAWYFEEDPELAARFAVEIVRVFDLILENPLAWTALEPNIRRALLHGFPYSVIYRVEPERLLVITVTHQHREPTHWRGRSSP